MKTSAWWWSELSLPATWNARQHPCYGGPRPWRYGYCRAGLLAFASAVDVCVNLRYPSAGESSGIAIGLMGIGKPTMLTRSEETAKYPNRLASRSIPDRRKKKCSNIYMTWLAGSSACGVEIGRHAAAHIASAHDARKCAIGILGSAPA